MAFENIKEGERVLLLTEGMAYEWSSPAFLIPYKVTSVTRYKFRVDFGGKVREFEKQTGMEARYAQSADDYHKATPYDFKRDQSKEIILHEQRVKSLVRISKSLALLNKRLAKFDGKTNYLEIEKALSPVLKLV